MFRFILIFLLIVTAVLSDAQEVLTGLQFDPVIREKSREYRMLKASGLKEDTIPVSLPFFDDFSKGGIYPSPDRWIDRYAYVNTDYPVYPVNIGAVTLDAINDSGNMYRDAIPGPQAFIADHLTSRYIRLDSVFTPVPRALTPADSVYLSFYYQPQGRGLFPNSTDSLVLQFLVEPAHDSITPTDTIPIPDRWANIWSAPGSALDTFYLENKTYFKQVLIPVTDTVFFRKTFRFCFFNYVSLASSALPSWQSNCDQWNIDNIYLAAGRNRYDTLLPELRFIERVPSMLKRNTSMPYSQYKNDPTSEMNDTLDVLMSNRDILNHNSTYGYTVSSLTGGFYKSYNGGQHVIQPFYQYGYETYIPFAHPPVEFLLPVGPSDSAAFGIVHTVTSIDAGPVYGDTIRGFQYLYNYYSYDDGTPEAGYGLKGAQAQMAYRFKLNQSPDTLRAVSIFFNRTLSKANQQFFYLTVWNDNNGKPGDTVYSRLAYPWYTDTLNKFYTYHLEKPVRISGYFYVGTIQTTDDNLNIGYDRYNNSQENLFYNATGEWQNSSYSGSLLVHPIVGKPIPVGIPDIRMKAGQLLLYPNPCYGGTVRLSVPGVDLFPGTNEGWEVRIFNLIGKTLLAAPCSGTVDISRFSSGLYIVLLQNRERSRIYSGKLLIGR